MSPGTVTNEQKAEKGGFHFLTRTVKGDSKLLLSAGDKETTISRYAIHSLCLVLTLVQYQTLSL